jgi:hypothetical protein
MKGNVPEEEMRPGAKGGRSRLPAADRPSPLDDTEVGAVLRSVYKQTIDEDVPAEMLDLLKKLT